MDTKLKLYMVTQCRILHAYRPNALVLCILNLYKNLYNQNFIILYK